MADDKIQREIEDLLSRLDDFLPEESVASKVRQRSAGAAASFWHALIAPVAGISLRQVTLAALALILVGFLVGRAYAFGQWVLVAGVILLLTSIALSFFSRGAAPSEKRWRGQPLELASPSLGERLRAWFRAKRRSRY